MTFSNISPKPGILGNTISQWLSIVIQAKERDWDKSESRPKKKKKKKIVKKEKREKKVLKHIAIFSNVCLSIIIIFLFLVKKKERAFTKPSQIYLWLSQKLSHWMAEL